ncbi:MAG: hypothetical protein CM1200mP41_02440 [Gammaproteobacteria bacterium]|nr:MAG: hypothetical protein CM1200mP41_02440 [Gammaproteobacteria bacterium]
MEGINECLRNSETLARSSVIQRCLMWFSVKKRAPIIVTSVAETTQGRAFNSTLQANQILKSPGKFYISLAFTDTDLEQTLAAVQLAARQLTH